MKTISVPAVSISDTGREKPEDSNENVNGSGDSEPETEVAAQPVVDYEENRVGEDEEDEEEDEVWISTTVPKS